VFRSRDYMLCTPTILIFAFKREQSARHEAG
jgi:hypothetical protein